MSDDPSFQEQVALVLLDYGNKQEALAVALDVDASTVWRWVTGSTTTPHKRAREAVAVLYAEHVARERADRRLTAATLDYLNSTKDKPC